MQSEAEAQGIMANIRLVKKIANRTMRTVYDPAIDFEDLVSEGCIGVLECIRKYNDNPYSFSTYLYRTVHGKIRAFVDRNKPVKVPANVVLLAMRIHRKGLNTIAEAMHEFGCSETVAQSAFYYLHMQVDSMEKPILQSKRDGEATSICDITHGPSDDLTQQIVEEFLNRLKPYERETIELLMMGFENRDIQRMQGLSHGAVRERLVRIRKKYEHYKDGTIPIDRRKKA